MRYKKTLDPDIQIVTQKRGMIKYRRRSTGQMWIVRGECNQCGLCVIGAANQHDYEWTKAPGNPGAVKDVRFPVRPDEPVTPGFNEAMERQAGMTPTATVKGCSLRVGRYYAHK